MEDNDIIKQVSGTAYPNEIARLRVSVQDMSVVPISVFSNVTEAKSAMSSKKIRKDTDSSHGGGHSNSSNNTVEYIWKLLGLNKIDISYACIGYAYDGSPILDHDDLVELLLAYGFSIDIVMAFVDDFSEHSSKNEGTPIVMFRKNTADIRSSIEPIIDGAKK